MNLMHRCLVTVCRHSWRAYGHANFSVTQDGLCIPIVGRIGLTNLNYRQPQFQVVLKAAMAVRPGGYIIDIGANIGAFLLNLVSLNRTQPYLGFEPLLPAAAYVRRLISENCLKSHDVLAIALNDRQGTATMHFGAQDDASATLSDEMRPATMYANQQLVSISTADIHLSTLPAITFIKLDVEGQEINVLRGMTETINHHRPPFLLEVMPYAYFLDGSYDQRYFGKLPDTEAVRIGENRKQHCHTLDKFFRDQKYDFFTCSSKGKILAAKTLDRGKSKDVNTDFLLLPREMHVEFLAHLM